MSPLRSRGPKLTRRAASGRIARAGTVGLGVTGEARERALARRQLRADLGERGVEVGAADGRALGELELGWLTAPVRWHAGAERERRPGPHAAPRTARDSLQVGDGARLDDGHEAQEGEGGGAREHEKGDA